MLRTAAGAHVEAVGDEARLERVERHAPNVTGFAIAFEPVQHHDMADRFRDGTLSFDQHLRIGICPDQEALFREGSVIVASRPEIPDDGQDVRITDDRFEGPHAGENTIIAGRGGPGDNGAGENAYFT